MELQTLLRLLRLIRDEANKLKDGNKVVYSLNELIDQLEDEGVS
jgi:hypothetical protein